MYVMRLSIALGVIITVMISNDALKLQPCTAFIQPKPPTSRLLWQPLHSFNEETSYDDDTRYRRRRKLVDRSNVYHKDSSPTVTLEEEEKELCYLDDLPGTDAGKTCFVSSSDSLSSDPDSSKFLESLPFSIPTTFIDLALRYIPIVSC